MGKESHLRAERKRAHRQLERRTVFPILTPKRLSYLAAGAIAEAILTGCASNNTPPQQYELALPPYVLDTFTQNIAVPAQFAHQTDAINLVKCPPQIDISNAQLATVSVGFDPGNGFTFTLTPREGVEGMISVTAKVQAVGSDGSCVVAGIAQGSAEVDTKDTNCLQTGSEEKKALGSCDGGGSINVEGQIIPIQDGKFSAPINDASHTATGIVNDGHGNITSVNLAIAAQCDVKGDMQLNAGGNGYQVPVACDTAANLSTDLSGPVGSVGGADQLINVAVRGGDGQQTTISAESHGFVTQTQFVAPTFGPEGNPQILVGGVYIREGKIILDNVTYQKAVLNAPCIVNGVPISNGQTADIALGNAILGPGGQDLSIAASDPAQRTSIYTVKQPPYNPFEAIKVFLNTLEGKTLSLHITSGDDITESIAGI
ncbi:MAG: hypothetical protein NTZ55_02485, partial [Candidatus Roizmanbacteria bacterium]|nr:hypothetical protein [Candidatus Roizmanbacteria bacterium]